MSDRKGIILAGGSGTRLYPLTVGVSKQLLPIYDKPMIYYPLSVLMQSGIRDIAIITTPADQTQFKRFLGDGSQWGIRLSYIEQPKPEGLAQAYLLAEDFLAGAPSAMILGDNLFFGHGLIDLLSDANQQSTGATVFGYHVADPERYGVMSFDTSGAVETIIEKPSNPATNYAVTGLYFMDNTASSRAKDVKPSQRGELEITSLLESYLDDKQLTAKTMGRGFAWLDTGTHASLLDASNYVRTITVRQGLQVGSPDEIAFRNKYITADDILERAALFDKNEYGQYLKQLAQSAH